MNKALILFSVSLLLVGVFLFPPIAYAKSKAHKWNFIEKSIFLRTCDRYGQTDEACQCGLDSVSSKYTFSKAIHKLYVKSLVKRHLTPEAKAIFDSCGGKWDSLKKKR